MTQHLLWSVLISSVSPVLDYKYVPESANRYGRNAKG
jgi:hypothetical protein